MRKVPTGLLLGICVLLAAPVSALGQTAAEPVLFIRMPSAARKIDNPTAADISRFYDRRGQYLATSELELLADPALASEVLGESQIFDELRQFEALHKVPARIRFVDWRDALRYFSDYVSEPENPPAVAQLGDTWAGYFRSLDVISYERQHDWGVRVVWYWRHLIDPEKLRTGPEFLATCAELRRTRPEGVVAPLAIASAPSWDLLHDLSVWLYNGGVPALISDERKFGVLPWREAVFAGPEGERASRFLIHLVREDLVALPEQIGPEVAEDFLDGKYAMVILGPWVAGRARSKLGADWISKIGVTLPPTLTEQPATTVKLGSLLVVLDPSRGRDHLGNSRGRLLVDFLTSGPSQIRCTQDLGDLPASTEALSQRPFSDFYKEVLAQARSYPPIPEWAPVVENLVTRDNLYAFWKRLAALKRTEGASASEQQNREKLILAALHSAEAEINRSLSIGKLSAMLPWLLVALVGLSLATGFSVWRRHVEIRRSRARLAESEAKYRDLYDHAPDMFCSVDVASGQILECNHTLVTRTGYTKEEIVGRLVFEMYHPDCRDRARKAFDTFRETGRIEEMELELRAKDGEKIAVSVGVSAVRDDSGKILRTRSVWRDVTRRKQAEETAERRRQELAHVARLATMGELAASMAHELNQPLTAVVSNAQAAQRLAAKETPNLPKVREILGDIAKEGHRAGQVIRVLRNLVKKTDFRSDEVDVNGVIREVLSLLRGQTPLKHVTVRFDLAAHLPRVPADRTQLEQVVVNLVLNAAEAMQSPECKVRQLTIRTRESVAQIETAVEDTGPGIAECDTSRIFDAFYTTKTNGLGLGLSISRSIIEAHGGRLWATQNSERGTIFHFTLPLCGEARAEERPNESRE